MMKNNKYILILFLCLVTCSVVSADTVNISTITSNAEIVTSTQTVTSNIQTISLQQYQLMALNKNHELHEMKLKVQAAEQTAKGAFTQYFPKIFAGGGVANTGLLPNLTNIPAVSLPYIHDQNKGASLAMLSVTQPIFAGGRIVSGNKLAQAGEDAELQQYRVKQNEVYADAEKKYRQLQVLNGKMQTLISYEKMLNALHSQVKQALEVGVVSRTDYLRVKLKKEETTVKKSQLEKMISIAQKNFRLYVAMEPNIKIELINETEEVVEPLYSIDELKSQLAKRPEYKLLQINVKVAKLQKNMKVGGYLPSIAVGASFFRTDYFSDNHFDESKMNVQDTIAFGMVSIPLSDWWEASHSIKEMKLKEQSAKEQLESLSDYLLLDMESKLKDLETSYEQVKVAQIGLELAQANKLEYEDGYNSGIEKLSDYLEALSFEYANTNELDEAAAKYFQAKTLFLLSTNQINIQ